MSHFTFSPKSVDGYLLGKSGINEELEIISSSSSSSSMPLSSATLTSDGWTAGGQKKKKTTTTTVSDVFFTLNTSGGDKSQLNEEEEEEKDLMKWSKDLNRSAFSSIVASSSSSSERFANRRNDEEDEPTSTVDQNQSLWSSGDLLPSSFSSCGGLASFSNLSPRRASKFQSLSNRRLCLLNEKTSSTLLGLEMDTGMSSSLTHRGHSSLLSAGEDSLVGGSRSSSNSRGLTVLPSVSPSLPNFHHRRDSFLYRASVESLEGDTSQKCHSLFAIREQYPSAEEIVVTPYAQILQTLRRVRSNYMVIANLPSIRSRRFASERQESNVVSRSSLSEEQCCKLSLETLDDLEWCLEQLETVQSHKSVGDLATNKFRKLLSRELNQFAESTKAGSQISEFICNTFLDAQKDVDFPSRKLSEEDEHQTPSCVGLIDHSKRMSIISGVRTNSNSNKNNCQEEIPKFGVKSSDEKTLQAVMNGIGQWGLDVFKIKELTNNRPLTCLTYTVLKERNLFEELSIPESTVINYFTQLESHYRQEVSYHNSLHGADVMQSCHFLLSVPAFQDVFTPLEILAVIFGAAIHDVDHPGLTNQYLINSNSELAIMYNDISVLENHHLALAFKLLQTDGCDIFVNISPKSRQTLRRMVIDVVLATDMSKHMSLLADLKTMVETKALASSEVFQMDNYNDRITVLQNMVHCCDLSNPTKPLHLYRQWTDRIMEEFFRQGDLEKEKGLDISPMCDRLTATVEKTQVGFIDYVVHPLWETWADLVFPDCQEILDTLQDNRQWYQAQVTSSQANDLDKVPCKADVGIDDDRSKPGSKETLECLSEESNSAVVREEKLIAQSLTADDIDREKKVCVGLPLRSGRGPASVDAAASRNKPPSKERPS